MHFSVQMKLAILVVSMVVGAAGWAAPKSDHSEGMRDGLPPTSNRQSLSDADRAQDRADERRSDSGMEHSQAREQQLEHAPNRGYEHRNEHSLQAPGHQGQGKQRR